MIQPNLFDTKPAFEQRLKNAHFNGSDYVPEKDDIRLRGQTKRVYDLMRDGRFRTLDQIARATGDPHASVSAQLRHLKKRRFGSHTVNKKNLGNGLWSYQLIVNEE